ncbi:hypothetical protein [Streptomyces nojiriensis]|uniref:hypothetical protein n=1 Tax=Streptomyces nojiriensis TaxID=66374 RepID=UPI003658A052
MRTESESGGTSAAWKHYAEYLRSLLEECGQSVRPCLPGEKDDCGDDYAQHSLSYLAAIKAKADVGLWHVHHGQPDGEHMANQLYEKFRKRFEEEERCGGNCQPM